jgi:hypothetical protein
MGNMLARNFAPFVRVGSATDEFDSRLHARLVLHQLMLNTTTVDDPLAPVTLDGCMLCHDGGEGGVQDR